MGSVRNPLPTAPTGLSNGLIWSKGGYASIV
jgi:hypothetical protein